MAGLKLISVRDGGGRAGGGAGREGAARLYACSLRSTPAPGAGSDVSTKENDVKHQ